MRSIVEVRLFINESGETTEPPTFELVLLTPGSVGVTRQFYAESQTQVLEKLADALVEVLKTS